MKAFSILEVPQYLRKKLEKSAIGIGIDYKRFNIKNRKVMEILPLILRRANDCDNSNTSYDGEITFLRVRSPRGVAHQVLISLVGIGPVPIMYIEEYWVGQGLAWSIARVDFYGGYFHFRNSVPERIHNVYKKLDELGTENIDVRVTRIDIAMDFDFLFPKKGGSWIVPCANSNRSIVSYTTMWLYNSFGYLTNKNSWYWIRIYNKKLEVEKSGKWNWYGGKSALPDNWTRIEFEFYPPYCSEKSEEWLLQACWSRVTDSITLSLGLLTVPKIGFEVENAYQYFLRYAKSHGISMEALLSCVYDYHIYTQEKKEIHWLIDEEE